MTIEEILENNKFYRQEKQRLIEEYYELERKISAIDENVISPCSFCNQDGFYRCEACREDCYRGFNDPDYLDKF